MNGVTLKIDRTDLKRVMESLTDHLTDSSGAMRKTGAIIRESIRTNFARGGRPESWRRLRTRQGQPLRDTNRLMNSITSVAGKDSVRVGTNVEYAGLHQYGARKHSFGTFTVQVGPHYRATKSGKQAGVRGHTRRVKLPWGDVPARPFVMIQAEDVPEIQAILARHIIQGDR